MNEKQLRTFIKVCELKSFKRTAESLFISSVAVKSQIDALEEEFTSRFFIRGKRNFVLTEEGEYFLIKAKEILAKYDEIKNGLKFEEKNDLIIGFDSNVETTFLYKLKDHLDKQKGLKVEFKAIDCRHLFEYIEKEYVDIFFCPLPDILMPKSLAFEDIISLKLFALCSKNNAFSKNREIYIDDLANEDIYSTYVSTSRMYRDITKKFSKEKLHATSLEEFLLNRYKGVYLTTELPKRDIDSFTMIEIKDIVLPFGIIYKKGSYKKIKHIIEIYRQFFKDNSTASQ